jgi:dolichol-phosphate mannosyltransferase
MAPVVLAGVKTRILLPTFNESANIEPVLRRIFQAVPEVDVLVIDDSSPDGTAGTVERLRAEFARLKLMVRARREGLGKAYMAGMMQSLEAADALITMDADFSHDPASLPDLIAAARSHDLVVGSRYIRGGGSQGWDLRRRLLSRGANAYARLITGIPLQDVTSGFQLARTAALQRLDLAAVSASGFAFQIELKHRLWRLGASCTEVPIVFHPRRAGQSKLTGRVIAEGLVTPWRLRWLAR